MTTELNTHVNEMPPSEMPLRAPRVALRLLAREDLAMTLAWRNRDDVRRWFLHSDVLTLAQHESWFETHQAGDDALMFIVEELATRAPVGQVSIYNIDREVGEAEVGRFIAAQNASGKGFIREAIVALLEFAFGELNLSRVFLEVYADNERAIRLYESVGFVRIDADRPTSCGNKRAVVFMERRAASEAMQGVMP
jgi:RimJ/RimL family protein N-acetyltransferase